MAGVAKAGAPNRYLVSKQYATMMAKLDTPEDW
jgi:hypothetical protein